MNKIQTTLISYIRETIESPELVVKLGAWSDELLARRIFANYRDDSDESNAKLKGLRLTSFGLMFMKALFTGYEIDMPEGESLKASHLLYLERNSNLPYHCDMSGFVIYDPILGTKLKLAEGRISILIEMDR